MHSGKDFLSLAPITRCSGELPFSTINTQKGYSFHSPLYRPQTLSNSSPTTPKALVTYWSLSSLSCLYQTLLSPRSLFNCWNYPLSALRISLLLLSHLHYWLLSASALLLNVVFSKVPPWIIFSRRNLIQHFYVATRQYLHIRPLSWIPRSSARNSSQSPLCSYFRLTCPRWNSSSSSLSPWSNLFLLP